MTKKAIVCLKFKSNHPLEDVYKVSQEEKKAILKTKGLTNLFFHFNQETGIIGATYIFDDEINAREYINRFLMNGLGPKYGVIPNTFKIEISTLVEEFTDEVN